jgi:hypothetical protein
MSRLQTMSDVARTIGTSVNSVRYATLCAPVVPEVNCGRVRLYTPAQIRRLAKWIETHKRKAVAQAD